MLSTFGRCPFNSPCPSHLTVTDLRTWVHLGCGEEEKHHPQLVSITLLFAFAQPPLGVKTDQLSDTVCYLKTVEAIQQFVENNRFNLIEHLAGSIHHQVCTLVAATNTSLTSLKVTICKVAPPVPGIHGGVSFTYAAPLTFEAEGPSYLSPR